MPHLVLETSNNITDLADPRELLLALQARAVELVGFNPDRFKCRRLLNDYSHSGDGNPENAFVSLRISILPGRSAETIRELGQGLVEVLQQHYLRATQERCCEISVEVLEMPSTHYFKPSMVRSS